MAKKEYALIDDDGDALTFVLDMGAIVAPPLLFVRTEVGVYVTASDLRRVSELFKRWAVTLEGYENGEEAQPLLSPYEGAE